MKDPFIAVAPATLTPIKGKGNGGGVRPGVGCAGGVGLPTADPTGTRERANICGIAAPDRGHAREALTDAAGRTSGRGDGGPADLARGLARGRGGSAQSRYGAAERGKLKQCRSPSKPR